MRCGEAQRLRGVMMWRADTWALVGGEVTDYADMLTEARQIATGRMVKDAESLGADAIVGMRYASASVMQGAAEVIAYGTAVKFV